jgi:GT2 family glycosyltransferase
MPRERQPSIRRAAGRVRRLRRATIDRISVDQKARETRTLLGNGLFLPWYYCAQAGTNLSREEATSHYLEHGWREGLLPNPLTDFAATGLSPEEIRSSLLDGSAARFPVRSFLDDLALVRQAPGAAEHPGGPVGFFLELAGRGCAPAMVRGKPWADLEEQRRRQGRVLRLIEASGLFDRTHYERQTGSTFASERAALWHFLESGESAGLTPHPLFESAWYRRTTGVRNAGAFAHFLRMQQVAGPAGPHFDGTRYLADHPESADHPGGPLGHFCSHATTDDLTPADPQVAPAPLGQVLATVTRAATAYGEQRALVREPDRHWARWYVDRGFLPTAEDGTDEPVCIVSDARAWHDSDPSALTGLIAQTHRAWQLRVAVDEGSAPPPALAKAVADEPRITLVPTSAETPADRANAVLGASSESWYAFWTPLQSWSPRVLATLLAAATRHQAVMGEVVVAGEDKDEWLGPIAADPGALWRRPRTLAGVLLSRTLLSGSPFRAEAGEIYQWDFQLRTGVEPSYVPIIASRFKAEEIQPAGLGQRNNDEQVLRAATLLDWTALVDSVGSRTAGLTSLLIPAFRDWRYTWLAIETALASSRSDVEVVVVDNGSRREVTSILSAVFATDSRVQVHRLPANTNFATGSNVAFARSSGDKVVFLNNDTEARQGWLEPLLGALEEPGVLGAQPLLLYPDDSIQTAGTVFFGRGSIPGHLLASFPQEDLRPEVKLRFQAVTAACMAMRADVVADARGFDPHYANGMEDVDLCLRLGQAPGGHFVTVRDSVVVHHESKSPGRFARSESNRLRFLDTWGNRLPAPDSARWEEAGFEVTGHRATKGLALSGRRTALEPLLRRPPRTVAEGAGTGLPSLRWAIKISAHAGPRGDGWGDVAFARDLADALRRYGQEVVVDRRGAHERPMSDYLDDVRLSLRGLDPAVVQPGATNVLWVISHPDDVTDTELTGFDLVYAAGAPWAQEVACRTGREVRVLMQATNAERFTPAGPVPTGLGTVFVGSTRKVFRPVVRDAVEVGADLTVFGDGWEEYIDPAYVRAEHLPNEDLPAVYRGARIVLNDHWADMAQLGFLSNRLFDAAAAGARVVSDPVPGLEDVFGPSVQIYRSQAELTDLLRLDSKAWADDDTIAENATRIRAAHSFTQRARSILADVLDARDVPHGLR